MTRNFLKNKNKKGFTLLELLVVIAIIGILASVVMASLSSARKKAADAKMKAELNGISAALELYNNTYGTYIVANSGWYGGGEGWADYEDSGAYPRSLVRALKEEGYLSSTVLQSSQNYMIYYCGDRYVLSATLNYPTSQDLAGLSSVCGGALAYLHSSYGKNYEINN